MQTPQLCTTNMTAVVQGAQLNWEGVRRVCTVLAPYRLIADALCAELVEPINGNTDYAFTAAGYTRIFRAMIMPSEAVPDGIEEQVAMPVRVLISDLVRGKGFGEFLIGNWSTFSRHGVVQGSLTTVDSPKRCVEPEPVPDPEVVPSPEAPSPVPTTERPVARFAAATGRVFFVPPEEPAAGEPGTRVAVAYIEEDAGGAALPGSVARWYAGTVRGQSFSSPGAMIVRFDVDPHEACIVDAQEDEVVFGKAAADFVAEFPSAIRLFESTLRRSAGTRSVLYSDQLATVAEVISDYAEGAARMGLTDLCPTEARDETIRFYVDN